MTASLTPALIDALVTKCQASAALADVSVHDGWGLTVDTADSLFIGCDDPWDRSRGNTAGDSDQDWSALGVRERAQETLITCASVAWDGAGEVKAARDRAFAQVDAVQDIITADPRLGVNGVLSTSIVNLRYRPGIDDTGAVCLVLFDVRAVTRLL